ncbi:hypothetical protein JKF63_06264 [Porcisia hertigi]|uniref:Uncharacterized protein n=1 Tax=Porcisia hertigi TaxID=2761500 RepID=A0A836IHD8_9TRYP|nr:hypothetical protein JKF63_06264 [Porcisia hertigi]
MHVELARRGLMHLPSAVAMAVEATAVSLRRPRGVHVPQTPLTYVRHSPSSSSRTSTRDTARDSYSQFREQQHIFHRHSFYEKGSDAPRGNSAASKDGKEAHGHANGSRCGSDRSFSSSTASSQQREEDGRVYGMGSATAQQRRQVRQQWEKSFFGRLHYEEGMRSRFAEALQSEEEEEEMFRKSIAGQSHADLFPNWPEDEEAPLSEFKRLRPSLQLQYIVNRLSSGERRIRYAVDFGSLFMMAQLNLGEMMVREADALLRELGWMNDEVAAKIQEVQTLAAKTKYDFDLD